MAVFLVHLLDVQPRLADLLRVLRRPLPQEVSLPASPSIEALGAGGSALAPNTNQERLNYRVRTEARVVWREGGKCCIEHGHDVWRVPVRHFDCEGLREAAAREDGRRDRIHGAHQRPVDFWLLPGSHCQRGG